MSCHAICCAPTQLNFSVSPASRVCSVQSVVNVIGMQKMTPPIKDLLPRLTPVLKNRCVGVPYNHFALYACAAM